MATQHSGVFTEVDTSGRLALTSASKVTLTDATDLDDVQLYYDFGVDFFGDEFEINFTIGGVTGSNDRDKTRALLAVSNTVDSADAWDSSNNEAFGVAVFSSYHSTTWQLRLYDFEGGTHDNSTSYSDLDVRYCTLKRNGTAISCFIYTDATRETLEDTLTTTIPSAATSYRYLYWVNYWSGASGAGNTLSYYCEDVTLYEIWDLDPTGDGSSLDWAATGGTTHYTEIDDAVRQPTAPGLTTHISTSTNGADDDATYDTVSDIDTFVQASLWAYGYSGGAGGDAVNGSIYVNSGWETPVDFGFDAAPTWRSVSFLGDWTQADLNAVQSRSTAVHPTGGGSAVYEAYLRVTVSRVSAQPEGGFVPYPRPRGLQGGLSVVKGGFH